MHTCRQPKDADCSSIPAALAGRCTESGLFPNVCYPTSILRAAIATLLVPLVVACREEERPGRYAESHQSGSGNQGGTGPVVGVDDDCEESPPVPIDTSRLCGAQVVPVITKRPNLYFVLDVSGSMAEPIATGRTTSKLSAAKQSILAVANELGHRVNYGLAAFPSEPESGYESCLPGGEVFATKPGDPLECGESNGGPVLDDFADVLLSLSAWGGTPLGPTLDEIEADLLLLEGVTSVILMTDGAPNCNPEASCGVDQCGPNLESAEVPSGVCDDSYNCCDSSVVVEEDLPYLGVPEANCLDDDTVIEHLTALEEAAINTYVVGVPGSELFEDAMNAMATAGGTARDGDTAYYDVSDGDDLTAALGLIGSEIAQSCELVLDEPPDEPELLNVYFDAELIPADPVDGWSLSGDRLVLLGESCERVRAGTVAEIGLYSGCRTIIR